MYECVFMSCRVLLSPYLMSNAKNHVSQRFTSGVRSNSRRDHAMTMWAFVNVFENFCYCVCTIDGLGPLALSFRYSRWVLHFVSCQSELVATCMILSLLSGKKKRMWLAVCFDMQNPQDTLACHNPQRTIFHLHGVSICASLVV